MKEKPMTLSFTKIHAQGNSYIYFDYIGKELPDIDLTELARFVSDKNVGVGADGMVILLPDPDSDALIRIWNSDGSEAEICGNALRSVLLLLHKKSAAKQKKFSIKAGEEIITGSIAQSDKEYQSKITISKMKTIFFGGKKEDDHVENLINIDRWIGLPVSAGNPHFVIIDRFQEYSGDITDPDLIQRVGPMINHEGTFPEGVNVELVKIVNPRRIEVRVWERGSGETLSCGSGACAVVYAGLHLGFLDTVVDVKFPGGTVTININSKGTECDLIGTVTPVCTGIVEYPNG